MNCARSLQCELGKNEHNEEEWGQETIDSTSVNLELGLKWWKIRFESFSDECGLWNVTAMRVTELRAPLRHGQRRLVLS
jgi:hypothetical protein